jgi:hypothetical protein
MRKAAYILTSLLLTGTLMPQGVIGATLNSPSYRSEGSPKNKRIQYIKPPKKTGRRSAVTPYGDFCSRCSKYGTGSKPVNIN